jgi:hypothetical protein
MFRPIAGALALTALLSLPGTAGAAGVERHAAVVRADSDASSRRCACAVRRAVHVRVVRRNSRSVAVRLPLRLGYDPVPYRFGYSYPPYRYIDRYAVVRVRPMIYR